MKKPEILAPAGSFASLNAAINAGADAVYFGIADFNMRASAAVNFTFDDLPEVVKLCKANNVRTYITVNTILYNNDMNVMKHVIDEVKKNGVDAIIVADMAAILYARSIGVEVHISTQMSVSNIETVKFYSQFADRIVLARELSLEQVKEICTEIKKQNITGPKGNLVEIEVFAHGALCVAVSGRCSMSLFCYGKSANKGKCSQVCRHRFKVIDLDDDKELELDNNYIMSSADLCTIGMLPELLDSGVSVLKFEGRGKPGDYVDMVISTYKKAIDAIEKGEYTKENIELWNKDLGTVFNKGFSTGLYMGRSYAEWSGVYGSKATKEKIQIGRITHYYPKIGVAAMKIEAKDEIKKGEEFVILGNTTGVVKGKLESIIKNDKEVQVAGQGDEISFKVDKRVRENDVLYAVRNRVSTV